MCLLHFGGSLIHTSMTATHRLQPLKSSHSVTEDCEVSYLLFCVAKGWWDYALDRASTKYTDDPSLTRIFIIS